MKISTKTKNLTITDALDSFIEEKISPLKKFIDVLKEDLPEKGKTLAEVLVEVEKETQHHRKGEIYNCKLEVILPGKSLLVRSQSDDLKKAIVAARKELREEIEKYKFKNIDKHRREQGKAKRSA